MAYGKNTSTEYSRHYTDMRGVDLSGDGSSVPKNRFAYAENMYRDWEGDDPSAIESLPGYRRLTTLTGKVNGIHLHRRKSGNRLLVHSGNDLFSLDADDLTGNVSFKTEASGLADKKSISFQSGSCLFILDGEKMLKVYENGVIMFVSEEDGYEQPYVPTVFVNGTEYEQRNIMSSAFHEEYTVASPEEVLKESEGFSFRIISERGHTAAVTGYAGSDVTVSVPKRISAGGVDYAVTEIDPGALSGNTQLQSITLPEGVLTIGSAAFSSCSALQNVFLPDSLTSIGDKAFYSCKSLVNIWLGDGLEAIGENCFVSGTTAPLIRYPKSEADFRLIDGYDRLKNVSISYGERYGYCLVCIPVFSRASSVTLVRMNGVTHSFRTVMSEGYVRGVEFTEDKSALVGATFVISAVYSSTALSGVLPGENLSEQQKSYTGTGFDAVIHCRICECFDGRIFLCGNPDLPNTVFWSQRTRDGVNSGTYFGALNYFNDGIGAYPVTAMMNAGGELAVFKAGDDGTGSIFLHTPTDSGSDLLTKIYPVSYVHTGLSCRGSAIPFFDDPLFITEKGVLAIEKRALNLERSIACRSRNINRLLLTEDAENILAAKWCGYLVLIAGERMYLADSRSLFRADTGETEYEWYYADGIGSHSGDAAVYRYSSATPDGYIPAKHPDGICDMTLYEEPDGNGGKRLYSEEEGGKVAVYKTEERAGGKISPPTALFSDGARLIFGTADGALMIFNNDLRGIAPKALRESEAFDPEDYARVMGRRVHPSFYGFENHAPRYSLKFALDSCGIPHMTKDTVKGSLTLRLCALSPATLHVDVGSEHDGYTEEASIPGGVFDFIDTDFQSLAMDTARCVTLPVGERLRGWVEKQLAISSDRYLCPIGIYGASFRFTVRGKVRKY